MTDQNERSPNPSRRDVIAASAALLGSNVLADTAAGAVTALAAPSSQTGLQPAGYNILFILVDQEHFFDPWPFPVPAREWIRKNAIAFTNHQAASCVCSPARSVIYTGQHIQHSGIFDNLNYLWQPDLSVDVLTAGHRLSELGYFSTYQGKWHMSYNLDQVTHAIDAPFKQYREIIASYGFDDFFGVGDINDKSLGGYTFDNTTTAAVVSWMRTKAESLRQQGKPWFLAVNFVNPHDVMYVNSDLPGEVVQAKNHAIPIAPPPDDEIYRATWNDVPLPTTRRQPLNAPGRPRAQRIYQGIQDLLVGAWPDEDRRWRLLRNYYFNCIRDCDRQVERVLDALRINGMDKNTIIVFTADHGELGGNHQMRGKGNCAYKEQNHLPLMIVHPAYPGGKSCQAMTSQIDLIPTLMGLTGASNDAIATAGKDLKGRDCSHLLAAPETAAADALRPATLFNYNMLSYQDLKWNQKIIDFMMSGTIPAAEKIKRLLQDEPDFHDRCAIRSAFDGRYRFSRYFAPLKFNTPTTLEAILADNDLELYDLEDDPDEVDNLAADPKKNGDLILAMNSKLNGRIAEEVGDDDGSFLPIKNGKWFFPSPKDR